MWTHAGLSCCSKPMASAACSAPGLAASFHGPVLWVSLLLFRHSEVGCHSACWWLRTEPVSLTFFPTHASEPQGRLVAFTCFELPTATASLTLDTCQVRHLDPAP